MRAASPTVSTIARCLRRGVLCVIALAFLTVARPAAAEIRYSVSIAEPEHHTLQIEMVVWANSSADRDIVVSLPAWNAVYQVRDFSYRLRDLHATALRGGHEPLAVNELDKQTWRIALPPVDPSSPARGADIHYSIQWDDPGPFNTQVNARHAFINFAEVLLYVPGRRNEDSTVVFHGFPEGWKAAAELPNAPVDESRFAFSAPSYDKLVDAPVEIGKFEEFEFDSAGAHFRVVVDAKEWNRSRLEDGLRRITTSEIQLMAGAPFKEYTFFFHIGTFQEAGGGGMEHANCTAISAGSVEAAIQIAAHEFFHAWNVKRIRPQSLEPVDYTKEQYTRALWFAEGVTSTYGSYTLERSGIWTKDQFYGDLAGQIGELESRPARKWQSVEGSSLDTWFDKYPEYAFPDRSISYYNKGQIIGVMLDLAIREATDNHKSLDDVLRRLNTEYAQKGKFYNESEGIRATVEEISGKKFDDFFRRYVAGTTDIPYNDFLAAAGLALQPDSHAAAAFGFRATRAPASGIAVASVEPGSSAESAGLHVGDILLTVNGAQPGNPRRWLADHSPGDTIKLHVRRGEDELDLSFALGASSDTHYTLNELPNPTDRQLRIRNGLLHGSTD